MPSKSNIAVTVEALGNYLIRNIKLSCLLPVIIILFAIQCNNLIAAGSVDELRITSGIIGGKLNIKARGWAASNLLNDTLVSVDIFLNQKLVLSGAVQPYERPDVVSVMGRSDWLNTGWHLDGISREKINGNKWAPTAVAHFASGEKIDIACSQVELTRDDNIAYMKLAIFLVMLAIISVGLAAIIKYRPDSHVSQLVTNNILKRPIIIYLLAILSAFVILFLRRPDILLKPQFWAEDGFVWFQEALNLGPIQALLIPKGGYFQTISRLVLGIATMIPLGYAPLFSNIMALIIRAAPIGFLFTKRMEWISWPARMLIALYYVLMPNLWEVHANITNTFWYLAIYLFATIVADDPKTLGWKIHDIVILILAGLSSISIIFIFPCYLLKLWAQSEVAYGAGKSAASIMSRIRETGRQFLKPYSLLYLLICLIQGIAVMTSAMSTRSPAPLGLSDVVVVNIMSARVFLGALLPLKWGSTVWDLYLLNYTVTIASMFAIVYVIRSNNYRIGGLVWFAGLMILATLAKPQISLDMPQLPQLRDPNCGGRYFIVPAIAWFCILVQLVSSLKNRWKPVAYMMLASVVIAVGMASFKIPPMPDMRFDDYVKKYEQLAPGEKIVIPINPGGGWQIEITKK